MGGTTVINKGGATVINRGGTTVINKGGATVINKGGATVIGIHWSLTNTVKFSELCPSANSSVAEVVVNTVASVGVNAHCIVTLPNNPPVRTAL